MSEILATHLLKMKVFSNKCYDVIIYVHDVTKPCHVTHIILKMRISTPKIWQLWHFYENSYHNFNFIRI